MEDGGHTQQQDSLCVKDPEAGHYLSGQSTSTVPAQNTQQLRLYHPKDS